MGCDSGMPCKSCKLSNSSCKKIGSSQAARARAEKLQFDAYGNLSGVLMLLPRGVPNQNFSKADITELVFCKSSWSGVSALEDKATSTQGNDPSSSSSSLFTGHTSQQVIRSHPRSSLSRGGLSSDQPFSAHTATGTSTPLSPFWDASILSGAQTTFEPGPSGYRSSESGIPFDAIASNAYWFDDGQMAIDYPYVYQSVPSYL